MDEFVSADQPSCGTSALHQDEAGAMSEISVNSLCDVCEDIFARVKVGMRVYSWFYDILGLVDSAENGCIPAIRL